MQNSKQDFQAHLARLGFDLGGDPSAILQRLRSRMGEERFQKYMSVVQTVHDADSYNQIYDSMHDLIEANLLRSMSPDVTLEASYRLYERAFAVLRPGTRVLELGCWTGSLVSFIAANHPGCTVIGVDRAPRVIEKDQAHFSLPNLSFQLWDYRQAPPASLTNPPADLLLCSLGININRPPGAYVQLDPSDIRSAPAYRDELTELLPYFQNWRLAARDGSRLLAVLRVGSFPRFLAVLDAAVAAGWKPLTDEFESVIAQATNDVFPLLSFSAASDQPVTEDFALSCWMRIMQNTHHLVSVAEAVALGIYRSLGPKKVLSKRNFTNEQGFNVLEEIGTAGPLGYIYTQDARPSHRLDLLTLSAIHQQLRVTQRV